MAVVVDLLDLGTTNASRTGKFSLLAVAVVEGEERVVEEEAVVRCLLRLELALMEWGSRCCCSRSPSYPCSDTAAAA